MKKIILSNLLLLSMIISAEGAELDASSEFESLLEEVSAIATKKSINVDYLPSVVTVINAQTYVDAGIQNIGEALGMLPGIQIQLSPMGYTMTTVRGLKNPNAYLSDKIKILIDGVAINNEVTGSSNFYMDFPMQLVDKIEVLRGPGSTTYGAGAFYATVNIITKLGSSKKENQVFLGAGSYSYLTTGTNLYSEIGDWKIFADGYFQKNDKAIYFEAQDGDTDEAMKDFSIGLKATNGGFDFLTRFKHNVSGNFYSFENQLNPIEDKKQEHSNTYFFSEVSYKALFDDYKLDSKVNFSHRELDVSANIDNIAGTANKFATVDIDMQEGFVYREQSNEQNFEVETELTLPKINSNDMSVGVGAHYTKVTKDDFYSSVENAIILNKEAILNHVNYDSFRYRESKESAFWANMTRTLLKDNVSRTNYYVFFQDLISVNRDVDVVLGVRVDDYSDFGTKMSKRAAVVYRASDNAIFKLLYGSAFRAPTLIEAYQNGHINFRAGDENILPEETNTYEAVAIYSPNANNKFSLNLFYSQLSNVIDLEEFPDTDPGYQNFKSRYSRGAEFEYNLKTEMAHSLYFNASYIDAQYTIPAEEGELSIDQSMPDISKVMLKAIYIYKPITKLSFGTAWRYFAETTSTELQWVKDEADEYSAVAKAAHIFDETITYRFSPSSEARLTVKNIFNADVRQPSYYYYTSDGGFQREGRNYFLSYIQNF